MEQKLVQPQSFCAAAAAAAPSSSTYQNWLDIPNHVLDFITDKLIDIKDYIKFGAVCRSWRCIYIHNLPRRSRRHSPQLPLLMLPAEDGDPQTRVLYSTANNRVISNFRLLVPQNEYCRGSSQGWLFTVHDNLSDVRLVNPFMPVGSNEIKLPPLTELPHLDEEIFNPGFFTKAVFSANPAAAESSYLIMAIFGQLRSLAFLKHGDTTWTHLGFHYQVFDDIIYYNHHFYAVDFIGVVYVFDLNHHHHHHPQQPERKKIPAPPGNNVDALKKYLVESSGDLLLIRRLCAYTKDQVIYTPGFQVFSWDFSENKWFRVTSIGHRALFLGDNSSMSVSCLDFPGCNPDSIYFTDDNYEEIYAGDSGPHDLGVFNIKDGTVEPHYPLQSNTSIFPPPIWIEPTLQRFCN